MATTTTNYGLIKPEIFDYYSIQDDNDNMDSIDAALAPEADPTQAPSGNSGRLFQWVSWLTNRIKAITGGTNWYDAPTISLAQANNLISSHTADINNPHDVTASQVGAVPTDRTVNGHALSANVTVTASDVGLGNVTNVAQMPLAGGTFTGICYPQINTSYTTGQARRIRLYADGTTVPTLSNGEMAFTYV